MGAEVVKREKRDIYNERTGKVETRLVLICPPSWEARRGLWDDESPEAVERRRDGLCRSGRRKVDADAA